MNRSQIISYVLIGLVVSLLSSTIVLKNDVLLWISLFLIIGSLVANVVAYHTLRKSNELVFMVGLVDATHYNVASAVGYIFSLLFLINGYFVTAALLIMATLTDIMFRNSVLGARKKINERIESLSRSVESDPAE